jgi:calcineurin-like phosphoesterase family protein
MTEAVIEIGGHEINLVHNPAHADSSFKFNFCGHVHEKWKFQATKRNVLINVGTDVWNFRPISYTEIMEEFSKWKKQNSK